MITLNTDNGLVRIERWEDIESLPGYVDNLNPSQHKLKTIRGRYLFKDYIKCGLSNCHTSHGKGYIATTTDGLTTNIGKDCGKKYFGVDFETLSNQFDRDVTAAENRDRLGSFSFQIEELEERIRQLREGKSGANWVHKKSQQLSRPGGDCPNVIVHTISSMVKKRTNVLTISREATESELATAETQAGRRLQRPYYIEEPIAEINGFGALYPENNLKALLIDDLEVRLSAFKAKNIDSLDFDELRKWAKWVNSVDNVLEVAQQATELGKRLLTKENLEPLARFCKTRDDLSKFSSYLKSLCS